MDSDGYEKINIQWYPGHMTKARRMIEENISLVDAVCEIVDARIPMASRNPDIQRLAGEKPRIVILNKCDLADPKITKAWEKFFRDEGAQVLLTDAKSGKGVERFAPAVRTALAEKISSYEQKGQIGRSVKIMIMGIPNVGKSEFINKVAGKRIAETGDRPGVTRSKQWVRITPGIDMLDTPGILWPKFESQEVGELLAVTNAIKTDVFDAETMAANFLLRLRRFYPEAITARYKFTPDPEMNGMELLEEAAKKRGMLISGGEYDLSRMAHTLLKEYHEGKLGKLSLEKPE